MPRLGKGYRLKAKELRQKQPKELISMLSNIDIEISKFQGERHREGSTIKNPGMFNQLKKNRAIILTVLTENRRIQKNKKGGF